jgi:nucleotide-binding universal stress UspA family protein
VLHVVHDPASDPGSYETADAEGRLRPMEQSARQMLDEFLERVAKESRQVGALGSIETTLVTGLVPTRILEVAARLDALMIVMGNRGLTGLAQLLLGSNAQKVVQLSDIPVTIVKAAGCEGDSSEKKDP